MAIQFKWVNGSTGGASQKKLDSVTVTKNKGGETDGVQRYAAAITIPVEVMKSARFVIGDRVIIGFGIDSELGRCVAFKRVVNGGYKIGPATSARQDKGGAERCVGQMIRGRIQLTWNDSVHDGFEGPKENIKIDDDGTLIVWEGAQ